jgi:hypothetical protein
MWTVLNSISFDDRHQMVVDRHVEEGLTGKAN